MTAQATERTPRMPAAVKLYARHRVTVELADAATAPRPSIAARHYGAAAGVAGAAQLTDAARLYAQVANLRGEALRAFAEGVRAGADALGAVAEFAAQ